MSAPLLSIEGLGKTFVVRKGAFGRARRLHAVVDVSLDVGEGHVLGIVGESGCGKTTLGRMIARLIDPDAGVIRFGGTDISRLGARAMRPFRSQIQVVFQDPYASLNPRLTVGTIISRNLRIHATCRPDAIGMRVAELLESVGLRAEFARRYPHEFSGGQRQRVAIARALATNPRLIVADEPTSALDVSVQAQILNLLTALRQRLGLTLVLISHDIGVVNHMADRVAVMYLGKVVEVGAKEDVLRNPLHPYSQAMMASILVADPRRRLETIPLEGEVPSALDPPSGCRFRTRCGRRMSECASLEPPLRLAEGRLVACHLYNRPTRDANLRDENQ